MSFFTDEELVPNETQQDTAKLEELETEQPEPVAKEAEKPKEDSEDRIPAKYRGKSMEEIIAMHQHAEQWAQRQSEEVGFARKMAEQAAQALRQSDNGSPKRTDADQEDDQVEFFADPASKVKQLVSDHPDVQAARATVLELRQKEALEKVTKAVGDPAKYLNDPEFLEWAQKNPYRINSLRHANQNMDPDAAIEVFEKFDLEKGRKTEELNTQKDQVKDKVASDKRKAMVDAGTPGEKSAAKVYRRADLIRLQNTDPDRYERLMPEIMRAYSEGRVR